MQSSYYVIGAFPNKTGSGFSIGLYQDNCLSSFLNGVSASDPMTYVTVVFVLAGTAFLAVSIPAHRATLVSPTEALRDT